MKKALAVCFMLLVLGLPLLTVARITEFQLIQAINNGTAIPLAADVVLYEAQTALTNTVQTVVKIEHTTTGTAASGIGTGVSYIQDTAASGASNLETILKMDGVMTDVTGGSEDADFILSLQAAGAAAAEKFRVASTGLVTLVNGETIDNTVNSVLTFTSPTVAASAILDIGGNLVLQNDETIDNAVNGTVNVTATTFATTGGVDFGGDIVMQNDEFISNSTNGTLRLVSPTITNSATTVSNTMGSTGGLSLKVAEATATLSGASTTITLSIPTNAKIIGTQLRVDTAITTGDGATSWTATFAGGATLQIATGQAFTKDTKADVFFYLDGTDITSNTTNIAITPNANTFSGGVVRAIVYYYVFEAMANAP